MIISQSSTASLAIALFLSVVGCARSSAPAKDTKKDSAAPPKEIMLDPSPTVDQAGKPQGKEAVSLSDGNIKIWYADLGDNLGIRVVSPGTVIIHADINQNGSLDPTIDKKFGVLDDGSLCVQFEHDKSEGPACGEVASQAKSLVSTSGEQRDTFWKIPKAELGATVRAASISFEVYDPLSAQSAYFPGAPFVQVYKLRFGKAALAEGPAVVDRPVVQPPPGIKTLKAVPKTPVEKPVELPIPEVQPPVISWFTAEPDHIKAGDSVRLAWSVENSTNVTIEPGIGAVTPSDQRSERPSKSLTYTLTAVGMSGAVQSTSRAVEVVEPVEIQRFYQEKPVVFLDDTIVLAWQTKGATEVTIGLFDKPEGSRFQYLVTPQPPSGKLEIPVRRDQFTRYGNYSFQLVAKGLGGPASERGVASKIVKVYLRQR